MQQPRIDFGMILPMKFGLEQFLEMTKALKHIKDKYSKPQYNRCEPFKEENPLNKENQQPNSSMQSTSQTSQHGKITQNMQIGNVSVEQMAMSMDSDPDHLVEALEEVFCSQSTEEQDTQEEETAWLALSYDPDDYYVDLETSSSFSKHFNDICVITLGRMTGTTFPVTINL